MSQNLHSLGNCSPFSLFLSIGDIVSAEGRKKKKGRTLNNDRLSDYVIAHYEDKVFISSKHSLIP